MRIQRLLKPFLSVFFLGLVFLFLFRTRLFVPPRSEPVVPVPTYNTTVFWPRVNGSSQNENAHKLSFLIPEQDICQNEGEEFDMMFIVISALGNFDARAAIRRSWGKEIVEKYNSTKMAFLIAKKPNKTLQERILNESRTYRDIIQADFFDSYRNLTLKTITMVRWVKEFCPNAKLIFKIDDDNFVNMPKLISYVEDIKRENGSLSPALYGYLYDSPRPYRSKKHFPKWYISYKDYPYTHFPDYLAGTGYLMTQSAIEPLYNATHHVPSIFLEDAYLTGLCADFAEIPRYTNLCFHMRFYRKGCPLKNLINRQGLIPRKIFATWANFEKEVKNSMKKKQHPKQNKSTPPVI